MNVAEMTFYSRRSTSTNDDSKVVGIVLEILQLGFSMAALAFLSELIPKLLAKMKIVLKARFCTTNEDLPDIQYVQSEVVDIEYSRPKCDYTGWLTSPDAYFRW